MPPDPAIERAWMTQWRIAAVELAEQRRRELRAMSPAAALAAGDAVLSIGAIAPLAPARLHDSGLVQQQALFHRRSR
jgi:hypothetical protein